MGAGPLVIALDSSTSATKAVVVGEHGQVVASGSSPIGLLTPGMDRYEHDPKEWWTSTHAAISSALYSMSRTQKARIKGICITHQRESFALVDAEGQALRPAILWLDSRAGAEIKEYGSDEIHELSGKPADTTPAIYKMAWLKKHEPEELAEAAKVVDVHAFLSYHLVGEWVSAMGSADTLNLMDIEAQDYSDKLLEIAGVRRDQMADLAKPTETIGTLKPELAEEWGVNDDVVLIAGVGDGQASGLGTNAIAEDVAYVNVGTSVVCGIHTKSYAYDPSYRTLLAGIPGQYVLEIVQNSGSVLLNWFRKELGDPALDGRIDPKLDEAAAQVPLGSEGLLTVPYWNAVQSPYWEPFAKGVMVGFGSAHTRAHMYRSIMEGIAIELRENIRRVEKSTGRQIRELRATGGGSRNLLWRQIFADATGKPIIVSGVDEVSAQGAAIMGMVGIGAYDDVASAAEAMTTFTAQTEPNMETHERYGKIADVQQEIYPMVQDIFAKINEIQ